MTNKEFLTNVSLNNITAETIAYATEALRKNNKFAAKRKAEDALLMASSLVDLLTKSSKVLTAWEIADARRGLLPLRYFRE